MKWIRGARRKSELKVVRTAEGEFEADDKFQGERGRAG